MPEALRAALGRDGFVVTFRHDVGPVEIPDWAQEIATEVVAGAKVRLASLGTDSVVESVLVPRDAALDEDEACQLAERIAGRVEG